VLTVEETLGAPDGNYDEFGLLHQNLSEWDLPAN
jgi:hypothetical protein